MWSAVSSCLQEELRLLHLYFDEEGGQRLGGCGASQLVLVWRLCHLSSLPAIDNLSLAAMPLLMSLERTSLPPQASCCLVRTSLSR
jgi:hypothetical protein